MLTVLPRLLYGFVMLGALLVIAMLWRPIRAGDRQAKLLAVGAAAVMPASASFLFHGVSRSLEPIAGLAGWPLTDWPVLFFVTVLAHLGLEEVRRRSGFRSRLVSWLSDRPLWLYVPAVLTAPDFYARYLSGGSGLLATPAPYTTSMALVAAVLVISFALGLWSRLRARYRSARVLFHSILGLVSFCLLIGLTLGWVAVLAPDAMLSQLVRATASPLIETSMFLIVLRSIDAARLQPVEEFKARLRLPTLAVTGAATLVAVGVGATAGQVAREPWDSLLAAATPLVCMAGLAFWLLKKRPDGDAHAPQRRAKGESTAPPAGVEPPRPTSSPAALGEIPVFAALTGRQRQVVEKVARGMTNAEIAEEMVITEGTVKKHLTRIFRKVGVGSRTELIALLMGTATKTAKNA